ncbi:hypothetical protein Vretimale_18949 [Volvox reticuliferus]|uniref:Uncharacterized protein n=2 Tax=Volvox reticuliferus TaxID=1737510 RepID=A0A8J4LZH6_9CHLO|nr:hypothetical protein Vretimale_18949 [Volvox reticuliferus]
MLTAFQEASPGNTRLRTHRQYIHFFYWPPPSIIRSMNDLGTLHEESNEGQSCEGAGRYPGCLAGGCFSQIAKALKAKRTWQGHGGTAKIDAVPTFKRNWRGHA